MRDLSPVYIREHEVLLRVSRSNIDNCFAKNSINWTLEISPTRLSNASYSNI